MKINERLLESLASDTAPPDKCGFLMKKGEVNKGFQRRYFVLRGNMLFYFEKKQDRTPIGVVILENCYVELCSREESMFAFQIIFDGSGTRRYVLAADDNEEMLNWMTRITHAGFIFMKSLVDDLENKLEILKKVESEMVSDSNRNDEVLLKFGSDEEEKSTAATPVVQKLQLLPKPIPRSRYKTLPAKKLDRKEKVSLAELGNRWSVSADPRNNSKLLETRTAFHDWVDFSERTDFLCDDSNHLTRRFSINDFTPPSFMELKKHEQLEDEALFNLETMPNDVRMHETALPHSLANRIKGNRRAKSERHRRTLPARSSKGGTTSFYGQPKSLKKVSTVEDFGENSDSSDSHFQHLHRLWGASIWVKVRQFEVQQEKALETTV